MFELHITCTKDIDKLHIDFSDGTSIIKESQTPTRNNTNKKHSTKERENDIINETNETDWSEYQGKRNLVSQEIVEKPQIPDRNDVKVDDMLQGLEF